MISTTKRFAGVITLLVISSQSYANFVGLGIGRASEYPGSDDFEFSPNAAFEIDTPVGKLKNNGVGAELDIVKNTSVGSGPILRIGIGRDDTISDSVVAGLPEVELGTEVGWFIDSGFRVDRLGIQSDAIVIGSLDAVTEIGDGHGGVQITGSVGYVMQLTDNFRLVPSVGFNYVDDSYAESFYSVSSADAATTGLNEFDASGGLEYTQVALYGVRDIDSRWTVTGTIAFNKLTGDAADSPVTERGTTDQLFTGFILNYNF